MEDLLEKLLGESKLKLIDTIMKICPTARVGGSISLFYYGVINRPIGDLDIIIEKGESSLLERFEIEGQSDSDTNADEGNENNSKKIEIMGQSFCLFFNEKGKSINTNIGGINITIDHPQKAIDAKKIYLKRMEENKKTDSVSYKKHTNDILMYEKWQKWISKITQ